ELLDDLTLELDRMRAVLSPVQLADSQVLHLSTPRGALHSGFRRIHSFVRACTLMPPVSLSGSPLSTNEYKTLVRASYAPPVMRFVLRRRKRNTSQARSTISRTQMSSRISTGFTTADTRRRSSSYAAASSPS